MPDLLESIRATILGASSVTSELEAYLNSYPVFTRRPVPDDAPPVVVVVNPQFQSGQSDGMRDQRPSLTHDVAVYGPNEPAESYRKVERVSHALQQLFHRRPGSVSASGSWTVTDVTAVGPSPAPVDDEETVGRRVEITARLARLTP